MAAKPDNLLQVLLLGEANFSFAAALATLLECGQNPAVETYLGSHRPVHLVASGIEASAEEVIAKYPESEGLLAKLRLLADVRHGVNAWNLPASFAETRWDVVAWNHPHLGTEDLRLHRCLAAHFFHGVAAALRPRGRVVLPLLEGQEQRWRITEEAQRQGLALIALHRFDAADFPGYECKRNHTGKSFKSTATQRQHQVPFRSWAYHFGRGGEHPLCLTSLPVIGGAPCGLQIPAASQVCEICGKAYSSEQGLRTHRRQVHELHKYSTQSGESCSQCGKQLPSADALRQHMLAVHQRPGDGANAEGRLVESRGRGMRGAALLEIKVKDVRDTDDTRCACDICGMHFRPGLTHQEHMQALLPITALEVRCVCGKAFVEDRALRQHANTCKAALEHRSCDLNLSEV